MNATTMVRPGTGTPRSRPVPSRRPRAILPSARRVLAVVARPGDESRYLGAVLDAFHERGAGVGVLAFTLGEASPYDDSMERLESIRPLEFARAASVLHAEHLTLADYPDNALSRFPVERLAEHVTRAIREWGADLLLTVDGRTAERTAAHAAVHAGNAGGVPVLGWTLPHEVARAVNAVAGLAVTGDARRRIDVELTVPDRRVQWRAMREHRSQAPGDRLELARLAVQGDREWLRWLVPADRRRRCDEHLRG